MPYKPKPKIKDADFRKTAGYSKKRTPKLPAKGRLNALPASPKELDESAKRVFQDICKDMLDRGLLYAGDIDFVAICACAVADFYAIRKRVKREGLLKKNRLNPLTKEMKASADLALKYAQALRLLPFGREKSPGNDDVEVKDVFAELIKLKNNK